MRALTVQQPWAWAIVHGGKDVENRTQAWGYRGPLAIHAGARWSERGGHSRLVAESFVRDRQRLGIRGWLEEGAFSKLLDSFEEVGIDERLFEYGSIIGVVDLVDVHVAQPDWIDKMRTACCESSWGESQYDEHGGRTRRDIVHLELENPRPLEVPIPAKGRLGLWTPDPDLLAQIREQVPA